MKYEKALLLLNFFFLLISKIYLWNIHSNHVLHILRDHTQNIIMKTAYYIYRFNLNKWKIIFRQVDDKLNVNKIKKKSGKLELNISSEQEKKNKTMTLNLCLLKMPLLLHQQLTFLHFNSKNTRKNLSISLCIYFFFLLIVIFNLSHSHFYYLLCNQKKLCRPKNCYSFFIDLNHNTDSSVQLLMCNWWIISINAFIKNIHFSIGPDRINDPPDFRFTFFTKYSQPRPHWQWYLQHIHLW